MGYYLKFLQLFAHFVLWLYGMCDMDNMVNMGSCRGEPWLNVVCTVQFVWNGKAKEAFEPLKDTICTSPVLAQCEEWYEYMLNCDASKYAVGAVLSQKHKDEETRVITLCSRKLNSAEIWYPTENRELLEICDTVVNCCYYLHSDRDFIVYSVHASSRQILTHPWLTAWQME